MAQELEQELGKREPLERLVRRLCAALLAWFLHRIPLGGILVGR